MTNDQEATQKCPSCGGVLKHADNCPVYNFTPEVDNAMEVLCRCDTKTNADLILAALQHPSREAELVEALKECVALIKYEELPLKIRNLFNAK